MSCCSVHSGRRTRGVFMAWLDRLAAKSRRQADYAWTVLALVLSWSVDRGRKRTIPARGAVDYIADQAQIRYGLRTMRQHSSSTHQPLDPRVECRDLRFLQRLVPPAGNTAPTHLRQFARAVFRDDNVGGVCRVYFTRGGMLCGGVSIVSR
jgi:hypothetical protein